MPRTSPPTPLKIVVVEDHAGFREQLCLSLGGLGDIEVAHQTDTAESAVQWIEAHPDDWDLAVIDVFLARGHGFQVLRACRERESTQKAVLLTSYTREPVREQAGKLGADAVFDKGVELHSFLSYVQSCGMERTTRHMT